MIANAIHGLVRGPTEGPLGLEALTLALCGGDPLPCTSVAGAIENVAEALENVADAIRYHADAAGKDGGK